MARRRVRRSILSRSLAVLALVATLVGSLLTAGPAGAATTRPYYLALGDSVAFGYTPPEVTPVADYLNAKNFHGYPEFLGKLGSIDRNASCPGETSASFIDTTAPSNGCENSPDGGVVYRDNFPLHVNYAGSQLRYAERFLTAHTDTGLVSINIGANDLFLCQATTTDHCTGSDFSDTLHAIGANLTTILKGLRTAGYHRRIVVLEYYAIDYNDSVQVAGTTLLNQTLAGVAGKFHASLADGFAAFKTASGAGGDPCASGLLIALPGGGCNIHPSKAGQILLASTVFQAAVQ